MCDKKFYDMKVVVSEAMPDEIVMLVPPDVAETLDTLDSLRRSLHRAFFIDLRGSNERG